MDPPDGQGTAGSGRAGVVSVCPSPRSLHPLVSSRSLRASTLQPAPEEQTPKFLPAPHPVKLGEPQLCRLRNPHEHP